MSLLASGRPFKSTKLSNLRRRRFDPISRGAPRGIFTLLAPPFKRSREIYQRMLAGRQQREGTPVSSLAISNLSRRAAFVLLTSVNNCSYDVRNRSSPLSKKKELHARTRASFMVGQRTGYI